MSTGINPTNNVVPWAGLRTLTQRNLDIFLPGTKVVLVLRIPRERKNKPPVPQDTKIAFVHYKNADSINVHGVTKSSLGIDSRFKLDLEHLKGEIYLPQFNSRAEIVGEEIKIYVPPNTHPDVRTFIEDSVDFLETTMNLIADPNDAEMVETLNLFRLKLYPHRYN